MKSAVITAWVLAAVCLAVPARAQNAITVHFSDPSRPGLLKVHLLNGGMRVRGHTSNDVVITSESNRRLLNVVEENNVITVTSRTGSQSGDIEIEVPLKTNLLLRAQNSGEIFIEDVEGEIDADNTNGGVALNNVAGSVLAHSMNGRVIASLKELTVNKMLSLSSMNGNVEITIPPAAKANLKMRTDNGSAHSDFEILRTPSPSRGRFPLDKGLNGTINGGGADIDLRTLNGNIYIRKGK